MVSYFQVCRDSIDLIIQCLKAIVIFFLIFLYLITCFAVFYFLSTKPVGDSNKLEFYSYGEKDTKAIWA